MSFHHCSFHQRETNVSKSPNALLAESTMGPENGCKSCELQPTQKQFRGFGVIGVVSRSRPEKPPISCDHHPKPTFPARDVI